MAIKIGASILSANFLKLGEEIKHAENVGCDYIHVDVLDGRYVNNIAIGICVAKWLPMGTSLRIDAHLAVLEPQNLVDAFADIKMNAIIFHPESYPHHFQLIEQIRKRGMLAGIAISPSIFIESLKYILPEVDIVDQLAVNPGFPNQNYNLVVNQKIKELKRLKELYGYTYEIQVDGGINETTAKMAVDAGAETLITGSALFESEDMQKFVYEIKMLGKQKPS